MPYNEKHTRPVAGKRGGWRDLSFGKKLTDELDRKGLTKETRDALNDVREQERRERQYGDRPQPGYGKRAGKHISDTEDTGLDDDYDVAVRRMED